MPLTRKTPVRNDPARPTALTQIIGQKTKLENPVTPTLDSAHFQEIAADSREVVEFQHPI